jgi:hypothetical protein
MAMPLTDRNLSICISCNSCVSGKSCHYIRRGVRIKINTADWWKKFSSKYGATIADILINFHKHPELTAKDFGDLMGVSRERARQLITKIHGTTKSPRSSERCGLKTYSEHIQKIVTKLISLGYAPKRTKYSLFELNNGVSIFIRKFSFCPLTKGLHFSNYGNCIAQFAIGFYEGSIYVYPLVHPGKGHYYISRKSLNEFKEAWHLLDNRQVF